ncbi:glycoside hydrolase family 16 protein [Gordonia crocea]|nr:glycoside hydrolase family 16 protein [Gordonia crocea]
MAGASTIGCGNAGAAVSGVPAPRGNVLGWQHVYTDDFSGKALNRARWSRYSGTPGGDPASSWSPSHVRVGGSKLVLMGYRDGGRLVTGGVSNWRNAQLYGKWEVRARADASDEVTFHFLLWPRNEVWPPEIDFAESFGGARTKVDAFLHWRDAAGKRQKRQRVLRGDFTKWNTFGVEWTPSLVRYTINGRVWATETGGIVPSTPMWLGLQAQAGGCAKRAQWGGKRCPTVGTPAVTRVEIDWVAVYRPGLAL